MPTINVSQPDATLDLRDACLLSTVKARSIQDTTAQIDIEIAFLTVPIAQGLIVKVECHIGTTGARVELIAKDAKVRSVSSESAFDTSYEVKREDNDSAKVAPSFSLKAGGAEVETEIGESGSSTSISRAVSFHGGERLLAVTPVGDRAIRWSLRPHRGEKAVVDYLEGPLLLEARANWSRGDRPSFSVTAQPTDIRFFGPDGAAISKIGSLGLWLKLAALGVPLPTTDLRRHEIVFSEE